MANRPNSENSVKTRGLGLMDGTPSSSASSSTTPPPVQPDHFYTFEPATTSPFPPSPKSESDDESDAEDNGTGPGNKKILRPEDDPLATRGIPVFKPTMEEFQDFEGYMNKVECWGMRSGIVKIVPPKEWTESLPSIIPQLANVKLKTPIEQHMLGSAGLFRQQNVEKKRALSVREWAEMCAKEDLRAPGVDEVGLKADGAAGSTRSGRKRVVKEKKEKVVAKAEEEEEEDEEEDEEEASNAPPSPSPTTPQTKKRRATATHAHRIALLAQRATQDSAFLSTFDPQTSWLPPNTAAADYTPSFCSKLERRYWRNCGIARPAWYGADLAGSLFTPETTAWNVASLPSTLSRLLPASNKETALAGVNTPYLYFGMWRATFAWHVEDMDLFSINYIHFGAGKFWYAMPQGKAVALENTMRSKFPRDTSQCAQFLRHKSFLASPTLLAQSSCRPNVLVQHAGEFVVTFPRGYHAGFNLGFNCAESVNFALESWLEVGRKARVCGCVGDSVRINVDQLLEDRERERRGEPLDDGDEPESEEEEEDGEAKKRTPKKRKAPDADASPSQTKRAKTKPKPKPSPPSHPSTSSSTTKVRLTVKLPPAADSEPYPCCLCPSRSTADLLRVHDPPAKWSGCVNVVPKEKEKDAVGRERDGGEWKEVWMAHESCAVVVPETWVDEVDGPGGDGKERVVFGVDGIVKDRWNLKCSSCTRPRAKEHGAPIQCTKGKCPKAFHVSCAKESGESGVRYTVLEEVEKEVVLLDPSVDAAKENMDVDVGPGPGSASVAGEGGAAGAGEVIPAAAEKAKERGGSVIKIIKKVAYEVLCSQHNPAVAAAKKASKLDKVRTELLQLPFMARIKLRVSSGVFEVSLVRVIEERNAVEVLWDGGMKREFKWSSLVWGSTEGMDIGHKPSVPAPPVEAHVMSGSGPTILRMQIPGYASSSRSPRYTSSQPYAPAPYATGAYPYQPQIYGPPGPPNYSYGPGLPPPSYPYTIPPAPVASAYGPGSYSYTYGPPPPPAFMPGPSSMGAIPYYPPGTPAFTSSFHNTIASTVSSLTPRPELSGPPSYLPRAAVGGEPILPIQQQQRSGDNSSASSSSSNPATPTSTTEPEIAPEVRRALQELQSLSSLEPARIEAVLDAQPGLREAVKALLTRQHSLKTTS
ncbi:JmjC-domain-containing protein [Rickenella mellea]|uniref:[histone H3]-trimethyl-L-lysine(9) demethylase n=1 Tax=Rickenella mellea TaxID=50990 RepID=A0A4Y7Q2U7_9AGAM|nr:JmjC-domain-containing protein [Rickenella mellea]